MKKWVFVVMSAGFLARPTLAQVDSLTAPADTASAAVDTALVDTTSVVPPPPATALDTQSAAIEVVRRGGTISISGVYGGVLDPMPMFQLFDKGVTLLAARGLSTRYLFAFEVVSVLLLAALVGAAFLARKEVKDA